jgi:hypothetical protein
MCSGWAARTQDVRSTNHHPSIRQRQPNRNRCNPLKTNILRTLYPKIDRGQAARLLLHGVVDEGANVGLQLGAILVVQIDHVT